MMTHNKHPRSTSGSSEQYYGDLRKGAYLKRRAAYQMQARSGTPVQAGTLATKGKNPT